MSRKVPNNEKKIQNKKAKQKKTSPMKKTYQVKKNLRKQKIIIPRTRCSLQSKRKWRSSKREKTPSLKGKNKELTCNICKSKWRYQKICWKTVLGWWTEAFYQLFLQLQNWNHQRQQQVTGKMKVFSRQKISMKTFSLAIRLTRTQKTLMWKIILNFRRHLWKLSFQLLILNDC